MLATAPSFGRDDVGGLVDQAYATFSPVLMLPAGSARTKHVDAALREELFVRLRNGVSVRNRLFSAVAHGSLGIGSCSGLCGTGSTRACVPSFTPLRADTVEGSPTPNLSDVWTRYSGARFLFVAACAVIVIGGLRLGASILVPFALALFLAILTLPIMMGLRRARFPAPLAVLAAVLADVAVFGLIVLLAVRSLGDVQTRFPVYVARFRGLWLDWMAALEVRGVPVGGLASFEFVDARSMADLLGSTLQSVASILSATFVVLLILIFILNEATVFPEKFRAILGHDGESSPRLRKVVEEVQE